MSSRLTDCILVFLISTIVCACPQPEPRDAPPPPPPKVELPTDPWYVVPGEPALILAFQEFGELLPHIRESGFARAIGDWYGATRDILSDEGWSQLQELLQSSVIIVIYDHKEDDEIAPTLIVYQGDIRTWISNLSVIYELESGGTFVETEREVAGITQGTYQQDESTPVYWAQVGDIGVLSFKQTLVDDVLDIVRGDQDAFVKSERFLRVARGLKKSAQFILYSDLREDFQQPVLSSVENVGLSVHFDPGIRAELSIPLWHNDTELGWLDWLVTLVSEPVTSSLLPPSIIQETTLYLEGRASQEGVAHLLIEDDGSGCLLARLIPWIDPDLLVDLISPLLESISGSASFGVLRSQNSTHDIGGLVFQGIEPFGVIELTSKKAVVTVSFYLTIITNKLLGDDEDSVLKDIEFIDVDQIPVTILRTHALEIDIAYAFVDRFLVFGTVSAVSRMITLLQQPTSTPTDILAIEELIETPHQMLATLEALTVYENLKQAFSEELSYLTHGIAGGEQDLIELLLTVFPRWGIAAVVEPDHLQFHFAVDLLDVR